MLKWFLDRLKYQDAGKQGQNCWCGVLELWGGSGPGGMRGKEKGWHHTVSMDQKGGQQHRQIRVCVGYSPNVSKCIHYYFQKSRGKQSRARGKDGEKEVLDIWRENSLCIIWTLAISQRPLRWRLRPQSMMPRRSVAEPLWTETLQEEVRSLGVYSQRGLWDPHLFLFFYVSAMRRWASLPHMLAMMPCAAQAQSCATFWLWTETMSQSKPFFFMGSLSQHCSSNTKLTSTNRN